MEDARLCMSICQPTSSLKQAGPRQLNVEAVNLSSKISLFTGLLYDTTIKIGTPDKNVL